MINFKFGKSSNVLPGPETLVTLIDPRSPAAEAYRTLRTNLQFNSIEKPLKTLLVTSPQAGEDKSVVAANLAISFAQSGNRVILVDADLRRPALHGMFGLPNDQGVTTTLLNAANSNNGKPRAVALPLLSTSVENLRVLTSGPLPLNPAELVGSSLMRELIEQLRLEADYIVLDTPPVLAVTDAVVLAAKIDGVLLALKTGQTNRETAREAKEQLEKVRATLLGSVLTNAAPTRGSYSY